MQILVKRDPWCGYIGRRKRHRVRFVTFNPLYDTIFDRRLPDGDRPIFERRHPDGYFLFNLKILVKGDRWGAYMGWRKRHFVYCCTV